MRWEKVKFSELYSIPSRNGLTKPSKVRGTGYKMINMGELFANDRIYDIPMELVPLTEKEKDSKVETDDLLFARQSLVLSGAGKCCIVRDVSPLTVFESHIIRVRLKQTIADPLFYFYYFNSPISPIKSIVSQGVQAGIRASDLSELEVDFPPLDMQYHIADILSAYDDLIENNQKQIKLLEEAAQRLYKEWFVDLHFPGWENTKIVNGMPEGWGKTTIENVSSIVKRGISPRYNELASTTVINQKCIRQTIVDMTESRRQEKSFPDILALRDNDTVICSTGAGTLGRVGQIFGIYQKTTFDSHVTLVRAQDNFGKQYLFHTLKFNQERFMGMGHGSTNQLELSRSAIQNTELFHPTEELMIRFETMAQSLHDKITFLNRQNIMLKEARDRLLPKLMSGELEV